MKLNPAIFHQSQHLDEGYLLPPDSACRFCGSMQRSPVYTLQENPRVDLLHCATCHASSASRMPTTDALDRYYANYYTAPHSRDVDERVTFDNIERFGWHIAARVDHHMGESLINILDFGGGDGSIAVRIAECLLRKGFAAARITLVDLNETLCMVSDARIVLERYDKLDDLPQQSYHLVVASAIIEHVPEPRQILIRLLTLLKSGGIFYARTPWVLPLIRVSRPLGTHWDFTFPAHLHDLGQDFWAAFFANRWLSNHIAVLESRPSIVQTSLKEHLLRTLAAYTLKAPWYVLGRRYPFVGGWEIFVRKTSDAVIEVEPSGF